MDYKCETALPVTIDVLRPPTFSQLLKVLRNHTGYYHIVHFDGHGSYGTPLHTSCAAYEGHLIFESASGQSEPIETGRLSQLLAEYNIPIVVLNACQSGRIDGYAADPFSCVATGLLKAGIRSVVAMSYSLYLESV